MLKALPNTIVDAHHHLWDLNACHYPWLMEKGVKRFFGDPAPIQKDYLVADYRADAGAVPITKSVHIQVGVADDDAVKETHWLQAQADAHGLPNAIIAFIDLAAPDLQAKLDAHMAAANLRGVRQIVGRSAEEDAKTGSNALLENPAFLRGLKLLATRGLSFDLQLIPQQMARAAKLLGQVPELRVALCHMGSLSDFSADGRNHWRAGIAELAELPNLICKASGFGMFDHDWTAATVRDPFTTAVDLFSPSRIAFGSNFPVDKLHATGALLWERYGELAGEYTPDERQAMFASTAGAFYRI
jgi:predicted TIM-barrel fold metal-dependent hydrolase